jgi:apolipoprotein N-acyltransferase
MTRKKIVLILISAILMSLSFHPMGLHFLAWFGLVPLLFAIQNMRPSLTFRAGILFGFLFSLLSLFWLVFLQIETNIKILLFFGLILLFMYFGIYYGTGLLMVHKAGLWFLPFALTGLEFIRGIGELGFPWLSFGYSQARYPIIIQQASIYGVYGLSFWLILINVCLFKLINRKNVKNLVLYVVIFLIPLCYAMLHMKKPDGESIAIGVVQPNIDPNIKFTRAIREETFSRLINLSEKCNTAGLAATNEPLKLIVWPETAIPIFITFHGRYQQSVTELSSRINAPILTGTPIYDSKTQRVYNGAVVIEPDKEITQTYKKMHLVPFGEHIPFDQYIPFMRKIDVGGGDYAAGTEYVVFKTEEIKCSCLICFESIFPEISRESVKKGAVLLANITNDGWFGKISGAQQHNDMAILRAVENGVPLVRSANTGISMVVDKYGRILNETALFEEDFIVAQISVKPVKTIYRLFGDMLPILSLLLITGIMVFKTFSKERK